MSRLAPHLRFVFAALVVVAAGGFYLAREWYVVLPPRALAEATYVGSPTCASCHQQEHKLWLGSDHDRAMDLATDETVLADFNNTSFTRHGVTTRFFRRDGKFMVNTEGPDGGMRDYEIKYTFGVRPLQQYMVEFPDGRVQVLRVSWDTRKKEWFEVTPPDVPDERLEPGDPLHWTGITQNWNTTCADCHSTNVHKNYDVETNTYHTDFQEIDVSCEECHGPGSVHVDLARRWSPFWDRNVGYGLAALKSKETNTQLETCAKCHARRFQVHEDFRPGEPLLDYYEPSLLADALYHSDGQILDEVYEYGSFTQSRMHVNHVRCTDCHDPHSLKLKFTGNALCTQCHLPAKYDTPAHHHHTPLAGAGGHSESQAADGAGKSGGSAADAQVAASNGGRPRGDGTQCIECHMPSRLYMVIDERRDHSFRVPRPDLSVKLGTPNACNDCHTKESETAQWAADAIVKWYGPTRPEALPLWAPAIAAGREGKPEGEQLLLDLIDQKSTPPMVRATAIDLVASYSSARTNAAVLHALKDTEPLVRVAAVRRYASNDESQLLNALATAAADPVRSVRIAAASRLVHMPWQKLSDAQQIKFERAMKEFLESQKLGEDHAGAHLVLATLDRRGGRSADALKHLRKAIELEPYLAGPRFELAKLIKEIGGNAEEVRRLRAEEAELLERDAGLAPDNAMIYFQLANVRYLLGQLDEAQAAYAAAVERAPQSYELLMALALLHEKRYDLTGDEEQFKAAGAALKKLHEMRPEDPRAGLIFNELMGIRQRRQGSESPPQ